MLKLESGSLRLRGTGEALVGVPQVFVACAGQIAIRPQNLQRVQREGSAPASEKPSDREATDRDEAGGHRVTGTGCERVTESRVRT